MAYNLRYVTPTVRALEAVLIAIPLVCAGMAVHNLAVSGGVEMARLLAVGGHLGLTALICRQGTESEADSEAGDSERAGRQSEGLLRSRAREKLRVGTTAAARGPLKR